MSIQNSSDVLVATAIEYLKGVTDQTQRGRLVLAWMKQGGLVTTGAQGITTQKQIQIKQIQGQTYNPGQLHALTQANLYRKATFTNEVLYAADTLDAIDIAQNGGNVQLIDVYKERMPQVAMAIKNNLGRSLYCDNTVSGNEKLFTGVGSICKQDTSVAVVAADRIAIPSPTYAGLSTVPGAGGFGGTWTSGLSVKPNAAFGYDWPDGQGTSEFDAWTPKLFNEVSTSWGSTGATWQENCLAILTLGAGWIAQTAGEDKLPKIAITSATRVWQMKEKLRLASRYLLPHQASTDMGFPSAVQYEGLVVDQDFDCPANRTYLFNPSSMMLRLHGAPPQLETYEAGMFFGVGPVQVPASGAYSFQVWALGNYRYNPKYLACISDFHT